MAICSGGFLLDSPYNEIHTLKLDPKDPNIVYVGALGRLYGPNEEGNLAKFQLKEFDAAYSKARRMQDSPERTRLYQEMTKLMIAYAPWRVNTHRLRTDMWYPNVQGYKRNPILTYNFWKYIDIDTGAQK